MSKESFTTFEKAYGMPISSSPFSFFSLMAAHKFSLIFGAILLFATNIISAYLPRLINNGVELIEKSSPDFSSIKHVLINILILALIGFFIRTLSRVVVFNIGRAIEKEVRFIVFNRLTIMDDEFFMHQSVGELINYLTTDITNIRLFTGFAVLNFINIIFVFCITTPFLFSINYLLAIFALLPFPLVILATGKLTQSMFYKTKNYQKTLGLLQEHVQENLSGAQIVRLFHKQQAENERFKKANNKSFFASMELAKTRVLLFPVMRLVMGACIALILFMGVKAIILGHISLGDYVEINARVLQISWPAMSIGFILSVYHRGRASLFRINELLSIKPNIKDGPHNINNIQRIEVNNLNVSISSQFFLKDINFSIKKGEALGIVGKTGSGKSNLLKVLSRRINIDDSRIFFDNQDINSISLISFYSNISIVNQEPFLFSTTIKENICLFKENIDEKAYERALDEACLTNELKNFIVGDNTIIGERGIALSGGQRQRVALARAFFQNKPVLILDDALSAVDVNTKSIIINNLMNKKTERITIIATSNASDISFADKAIILHNGHIL